MMFATDHIYPDYRDNSKLNQLCDKYGKKSIKLTIVFLNFILLSTAQAMLGPMLEFAKTGHLVTFLAIKLPFIDEDSVWGFQFNLMIQTAITAVGTIGGLSIETTSCTINNTIMLCADIINLNCLEVTEQLEINGSSKVMVLSKLRNVFIKYADLDDYLLHMSDLYYWRMFSAPLLIVYSVSISVFCQYAVSFFFFLFS